MASLMLIISIGLLMDLITNSTFVSIAIIGISGISPGG
jgi:hypothetical protein